MNGIRDRVRHHLEVLVGEIGARPPGSPANRRATDHVHVSLRAVGRPLAALAVCNAVGVIALPAE